MGEEIAKLQERLGDVNREFEAFTYSVSHDLRAPIRHIEGYAKILREDAAERLTAEDLECLGRIENAVARMRQLLDDLLLRTRGADGRDRR